jgi:hypothetical protein
MRNNACIVALTLNDGGGIELGRHACVRSELVWQSTRVSRVFAFFYACGKYANSLYQPKEDCLVLFLRCKGIF